MEETKVTKEDVEHVAKLSRLEFNESESEQIRKDLDMIVSYCAILNEVEGNAKVETEAGHPRTDEVKQSLKKSDVIKNAPVHNESSFIVPRVVE